MNFKVYTAILTSWVVGYLVTNGYIDPQNSSAVSEQLDQLFGLVLIAAGVVGGLFHTIHEAKSKKTTVTSTNKVEVEEPTNQPKPQVVIAPEIIPVVETQPVVEVPVVEQTLSEAVAEQEEQPTTAPSASY